MRPPLKKKTSQLAKAWSIEDARRLYMFGQWGSGLFDINGQGEVMVRPGGGDSAAINLKDLIDELIERDITLPILLRFSEILKMRLEKIHAAFAAAAEAYDYKAHYQGVYPIKVNQHRQVVEDLLRFGRPHHFGLEAGSKPELLVALALVDDPEALIICNGYKDIEFIETALIGTKLGRHVCIVVEKLSEIDLIIKVAERLQVTPMIGVRAKLSSRGSGRWESSGGDQSKFGLFVSEILEAVERLQRAGRLDSLKLLHFHLGSQISDIRSIKEAMRECNQIFVELVRMGVGLTHLDVGGGLAVDYDGSKTNFAFSSNYDLEEYAADIVSAVVEACDKAEVAHPILVSESGRALVAHHAVLVFEVLGVSSLALGGEQIKSSPAMPDPLQALLEVRDEFSPKEFQEAFHDAIHYRDEALSLFNLGYLSLPDRALVEKVFWQICHRILMVSRGLDYVPDEMANLERLLSDTYFCNFSVFQSAPDHWAMKQLFPVVPIHRHSERPTRRATLADITCDSDGKVDQFIDLRDIKSVLELHEFTDEPYYLAMFLVGAYQEILGDMHNLFGDTHIVQVSTDESGGYAIDRIIEGDTVAEVLSYVEYDRRSLLHRMRNAIEGSVREKRITLRESAGFLRAYEEGLRGYTYLEGE